MRANNTQIWQSRKQIMKFQFPIYNFWMSKAIYINQDMLVNLTSGSEDFYEPKVIIKIFFLKTYTSK